MIVGIVALDHCFIVCIDYMLHNFQIIPHADPMCLLPVLGWSMTRDYEAVSDHIS